MDKTIRYDWHARRRIKWRKISQEEIESVFKQAREKRIFKIRGNKCI